MTGWRIGYTAGPPAIIKAMAKVQGQSTSNPTHLAQVATVAALTGPQECVATMRAAFDERRRAIVELLRAIPGVACREPKGAFYAFPDLGAFVGRHFGERQPIKDAVARCDWLCEPARAGVVPAQTWTPAPSSAVRARSPTRGSSRRSSRSLRWTSVTAVPKRARNNAVSTPTALPPMITAGPGRSAAV